jgi:hypothetical protein
MQTEITQRRVTCLRTYRPTETGPRIEMGTVAEVLFEGRIDFGAGPEPGVRLRVVTKPPIASEVQPGKEFEIRRGTFTAWWG